MSRYITPWYIPILLGVGFFWKEGISRASPAKVQIPKIKVISLFRGETTYQNYQSILWDVQNHQSCWNFPSKNKPIPPVPMCPWMPHALHLHQSIFIDPIVWLVRGRRTRRSRSRTGGVPRGGRTGRALVALVQGRLGSNWGWMMLVISLSSKV